MPQRDVTIPTADGTLDASLHIPGVGDGPWPAVIMFPDAGGLRPAFRDMGQTMADYGAALRNIWKPLVISLRRVPISMLVRIVPPLLTR